MKRILPILVITIFIVGVGIYATSTSNNSAPPNNNINLETQRDSCIITISGSQYDVSTLQRTHSGGNIFRCEEDMTRDFQLQHNMDLNRIEQYKIQN